MFFKIMIFALTFIQFSGVCHGQTSTSYQCWGCSISSHVRVLPYHTLRFFKILSFTICFTIPWWITHKQTISDILTWSTEFFNFKDFHKEVIENSIISCTVANLSSKYFPWSAEVFPVFLNQQYSNLFHRISLNFQCAEVFQDDDVVSLVMECCNGGDLFDLIASHVPQGGLAEPCAARVQAGTVTFLFKKKPWKPEQYFLGTFRL